MISNHSFRLVLILCIASLQIVSAQNDTIWYDAKWKKTTKAEASYYRPPVVKKGSFYEVKDYYRDHTLQMRGLSKFADKDHWEDIVKWYDKNGQLSQSLEYTNNRLDGDALSFYKQEELKGHYKDGLFISGKINMKASQYNLYLEKRDSMIVEVIYENDLNGIRTETYLKDNPKRFVLKRMFYDQSGELIGTAIRDSIEYRDQGTDVYYYYNPMQIKQIIDVNKDRREVIATYYPNGQLRDQLIRGRESKIIYYDKKGVPIDSVYVKQENRIRRFYNGKRITFFSDYNQDELALILSVEQYDKEGKLIVTEAYHKNQQLKTKTLYENNQKVSEVSYDEKGNKIAELTYKNYIPWNGTKITSDRLEEFEDGKLIKEVIYYRDTQQAFKVFENKTATFYDQKGNKLSEITSKQQDYFSPLDGTSYAIDANGRFLNISTYEKGILTHEIRYQYFYKDATKVGKEENFYDIITRSPSRKIQFYHDVDQKRNETIYKGYDAIKKIYYDRKGEQIGTYDPMTKEGLYIKYFYDSDEIQVYEERKNDEIVKRREYAIDYKSGRKESKYILIEDIDITDKATFYSKKGEVIAEVSFKDGKPWQGKAYDHKTRELFTIKNGKKDGVFKRYDYDDKLITKGMFKNDLKEGEFITYDSDGNKKEVKNYKAGRLEGKTVYYNADGSVSSSLIYKDDKPYEGKEIYQYRKGSDLIERWYEKGNVKKEVVTKDHEVKKVEYLDNERKYVEIYFKGSDQLKYKYYLDKGSLEGEVVRYAKQGEVLHKSLFDKGKLISGSILLKESAYGANPDNNVLLTKNEDHLEVTIYDPKGSTIFELKEKESDNGRYERANKLNFDTRYIYETSLY